ncbi:MAG: hypothetical protein PUJ42_07560 [Bacteroidales bacterium]|nr:hypothetical protein [Bacteroidales bacterium]
MHIPPPQPDRYRTIAKDTIIPQPPAPHMAGVHTISADVTGGTTGHRHHHTPSHWGTGVHTISADVTGGTTGHRHHNPPLSPYPRQSMQEES